MKNLIVFGATGGTGKLVVEQALQAGYSITVVVRNPDAFNIQHPKLEIIKGDVFQPHTFENALQGKDAVISCLGIAKNEPTTVYSEGMRNIMAAMQQADIQRIVCICSVAIIVPPKSSFVLKFMTKNILQRQYNYIYTDMITMEEILAKSNLDWTIIRAPWLWNTAYTGKYRSTINEHLSNPFRISRADLAEYIVQHIEDKKTFQARIEISY